MHPMIKEILISENEIVEKCKELGQKIDQEYQSSQPPLLVALLKGSVPFLSELIKHIKMDVEFDFMDVSSYEGTESIGDIRINKDLDRSIKGVDILLVEDIVDTGRTLKNVKEMLFNKGAASVKVVALLDKPSRRVVEDIHAEYIGFEIPDAFVVGFGLDYNQKYRNLPYIGVLKDECYK
ncbi:hypoxanthine phosphoribosyltransferase [Erysipelotrichaceae bacterium OH741_COT-311]|nr:hypoxanthine phosphoribosyltransferase [Erysipelotrichaceae bacterium]RRC91368.1 hypoxanthine phosphoribosyltransferase [Erysipelotrichaceae bacterium OH741_COT-311]